MYLLGGLRNRRFRPPPETGRGKHSINHNPQMPSKAYRRTPILEVNLLSEKRSSRSILHRGITGVRLLIAKHAGFLSNASLSFASFPFIAGIFGVLPPMESLLHIYMLINSPIASRVHEPIK